MLQCCEQVAFVMCSAQYIFRRTQMSASTNLRLCQTAGAQEFMVKHGEAMDHNDKLLAADEADGGEAPATADAPSTTEGKPSAAADQLADDVGSGLKVRLLCMNTCQGEGGRESGH